MKDRRLQTARPRLEELEDRLVPSVTSTSTNWSGYAVSAKAGAVTAVSGTWVVPAATGAGTAYSSDWVGIDGFNSSNVEQIGTDSDVYNGTPQYYAWYEMYPTASVEIPLAIHAGDTVTASVTYGPAGFTLSLADVTTGKSYTTTKAAAGAQRSSAEWVVEAPSSYSGILPLANFGTVTLTGAQATIRGTTGPVDASAWASSVYRINMVSRRSGASQDTTSALADSGSPATSSFTVTYNAPATSTPPRPRGWWWWRATDQADMATASALAGALLSATSRATPSPLPAIVQQPALVVPTGTVTFFSGPAPFRQAPAAGMGRSSDVGDAASGQGDQPAGSEALPAPGAPGGSGDQPAQPPSPDAVPMAAAAVPVT